MARKYRKIDPRIWSDERFVTLSEQEKLLALYCLSCPQGNRIGLFSFSIAMAAEYLAVNLSTMERRFRHVCSTMNWQYDDTCRVLFFPTWWKYNEPENGCVLLGNLDDLHDVPDTQLRSQFTSNTVFLAPEYRLKTGKHWTTQTTVQIMEKMAHVSSTLKTRVAHVMAQEQEQEQEQEQDITPIVPTGTNESFERFWDSFPPTRRQAKEAARTAWRKALKLIDAEALIAAAAEYAASPVAQSEYVKGPAPWLNQGCWSDDRRAWQRDGNGKPRAGAGQVHDPDAATKDPNHGKL